MRRTTLRLLLLSLFFLPLSASAALTQEKKAEEAERTGSVYRVDFAVHELEDGKRVNTRHYSLLLEGGLLEEGRGREGRIRASTKVPVLSGDNVQYMDVGLRLDCHLEESESGLRLQISFTISNFAVPEEKREARIPPLIREIRSTVHTVIQPGKPTVVSSVDDMATKRRYELEVTATKVK